MMYFTEPDPNTVSVSSSHSLNLRNEPMHPESVDSLASECPEDHSVPQECGMATAVNAL